MARKQREPKPKKVKEKKEKKPKKQKAPPPPPLLYNPLKNPMPNYCTYQMSLGEQLIAAVGAFLVGGVCSQVFYGGLFKEDGEATTMTYISAVVFIVVVGLAEVETGGGLSAPGAACGLQVGDVIEVREKSRSSVKFKGLLGEDAPMVTLPKWLTRDKNTLQGTVAAMPARDDIDFPVEEHLIVELYSK